MFGDKDAAATIAVSDLCNARGTSMKTPSVWSLLKSNRGHPLQEWELSGAGVPVGVRRTNQATAASWAVGDDFDAIVDELRSKGVSFEHYDDLPDTTREGDVHIAADFKAVWFKDPDGNILNLINQTV